MSGFVYFLVNRAMPGLIKIGFTQGSLDGRLAQLNGTGVPVPFDLGAAFAVREPLETEQAIHRALADRRYNNGREFFELSLSEALSRSLDLILPVICGGVGTVNNGEVACESFSSETLRILQALAGYGRTRGFSTYDLDDVNRESELEVENRLAQLSEAKLVREVSGRRQGERSRWFITSKGVKYLFDRSLVEEHMIKNHWG